MENMLTVTKVGCTKVYSTAPVNTPVSLLGYLSFSALPSHSRGLLALN